MNGSTELVITAIRELIKLSHEIAKEHGWWDGGERSLGDQFANFHSEISEAWEEIRKGMVLNGIYYSDTDEGPKPEGVAVELADLMIRVFDTCGFYGIPLVRALNEKMEYNKNRPYRHGGKKA